MQGVITLVPSLLAYILPIRVEKQSLVLISRTDRRRLATAIPFLIYLLLYRAVDVVVSRNGGLRPFDDLGNKSPDIFPYLLFSCRRYRRFYRTSSTEGVADPTYQC